MTVEAANVSPADSFREYVATRYLWGEEQPRHARKLTRVLSRHMRISGFASEQDALEAVIQAAEARSAARPRTIFLPNSGGAGSHWLEALLAEVAPVAACGEVYLPRPQLLTLRRMPVEERSFFLDCLHLAHAKVCLADAGRWEFINTAHFGGWELQAMMGEAKIVILLTRDPADTVISLTFRKPEFRSEAAPQATDEEYLNRTINYVRKFYGLTRRYQPDITVRFEDLKRDPVATLGVVAQELGYFTTTFDLEAAVHSLSAEQQRSDGRKTNLYVGPPVRVPQWAVDTARRELHSVAEQLGYV